MRRIAIGQFKFRPSRLEDNLAVLKQAISEAAGRGAELIVFPELCIPGYAALGLFHQRDFLEANMHCLREAAAHTRGLPVAAVVGLAVPPWEAGAADSRRGFNSAAALYDGAVVGMAHKILLPDHDIFWESRYFQAADRRRVITLNGRRLGIEICEDLWDADYYVKATDELTALGAELIINLSCSPFEYGKFEERLQLLRAAAVRSRRPIIYANGVGGQDGYDGEVVFDGRSMVVDGAGRLIGLGRAFAEDLLVVDMERAAECALLRRTAAAEVYDALTLALQDYCARCGFKRVYIGLSGGVDSAVTAAIAAAALGAENVIGVTMPSHVTGAETKTDALLTAANLGIRCEVRPIEGIYRAWEETAGRAHGSPAGLTRQNAQARIRGLILMEYANQDREGLVVCTGNKTESATGYCTLYGDMCGGLALIGDCGKLLVYELAAEHNRRAGWDQIPRRTLERIPTAELEPGQTDRDNLPADYPVLAPLVDEIVAGFPRRELEKRYPAEVVARACKMVYASEYKRRQAAPAVRVSGRAFGAGRRYPIDNRFW